MAVWAMIELGEKKSMKGIGGQVLRHSFDQNPVYGILKQKLKDKNEEL